MKKLIWQFYNTRVQQKINHTVKSVFPEERNKNLCKPVSDIKRTAYGQYIAIIPMINLLLRWTPVQQVYDIYL